MYPSQLSALIADGRAMKRVKIGDFTKELGKAFGSELGGAPARMSKIKGGNDFLPMAFAERLAKKIHYNSPVVRIEQDETSARAVVMQNGKPETLTADRILCTAPFSVLRKIQFPANFSEKKIKAINEL